MKALDSIKEIFSINIISRILCECLKLKFVFLKREKRWEVDIRDVSLFFYVFDEQHAIYYLSFRC